MARVMILGASGQDGKLLESTLLNNGDEVISVSREISSLKTPTSQSFSTRLVADIRDTPEILRIFRQYQPSTVVNFASMSSVWKCQQNSELSQEINQDAVLRILQELANLDYRYSEPIQFIQASSSEMYSETKGRPVSEETAVRPITVYGQHKAKVHERLLSYKDERKLNGTSVVLFNHESPLRPESFVTRKISLNLAKLRNKDIDKFTLGDLRVSRDWGYAPDYVRAISRLIGREDINSIVLASGQLVTLLDICETALKEFGYNDLSQIIDSSPENYRKHPSSGVVGDPSLAINLLGLSKSRNIHQILYEMVELDLWSLQHNGSTQRVQEWLQIQSRMKRV
jgi:GDPmannose 4,6-dehydratase